MNATLSLAMIVKDVEKTLERCLEGFKQCVDEIVIVDTGSIDRTVEIAKKYTDNIYHFKWVDDFSAARNFSFEKCTKDFICWVDGDDYILPEDIKKIRELDYSDKEMILCDYIYTHDEFGADKSVVPRERIIKRSLGLKWEQEIHEYILLINGYYISNIKTHHDKQHGTSERNLKILERIVQKNPSSRNLFYLGKEYIDFNRIDDAIIYLSKFLGCTDSFWENVYQAHYKLANCYLQKGDETKFKEHIFESIKIEDRQAEPFYFLGLYYMNKSQWDKAIQWYELCTRIERPKDLLSSYLPEYYTWLPNLNLSVCYSAIGEIQKAYDCNKKVLKYRPKDSRAINNERVLSEGLKKRKQLKDGLNKKLNLGCGGKSMAGYVNVDIFEDPRVDEVFDLDEIPYVDGTIGGISSEHALEHVPFQRAEKALKEWYRVLKPGGELLLKIPEFEDCCRKYLETPYENRKIKQWYKYTVYGIQKSQAGEPNGAQIHRFGYSQREIEEMLKDFGFIIDYSEKYNGWDTPSVGIRALKPVFPMKIGWVAPMNWDAAQVRIRVLNVNRWLRSRGYCSEIVDYKNIIDENYDIAIVGKEFNEDNYNSIKMLKQKGKTVYCDICEDLKDFQWVKKIIAICDKIICCSQTLADIYIPINSNVIVIEDAWET